MACKYCGNNKGKVVHMVLDKIFKKPQEVLAIYCVNCGNLMYGYCKNAN